MYKADVTPSEAYARLTSAKRTALIDVRTHAEWTFVGLPAVDGLVRVPWQMFPSMQMNPEFVAQVEAAGVARDAEVYLICRSGGRSASAAAALTEAGFANCFNVAGGFEGDRDENGHRGTVNGWKVEGLPWVQG